MKKSLLSFSLIIICFSHFTHGMDNPINAAQIGSTLCDLVVQIAAYSKPRQKNLLMKVCKSFNTQLKDREKIVQANPSTVSKSDKMKGMFFCAHTGNVAKLKVWLKYIKEEKIDINCPNVLNQMVYKVVSEKNQDEIRTLLLQYNAHKPEEHRWQYCELNHAIYWHDTKRVIALQDCHSNSFNMNCRLDPLHIAAYEGYVDLAQILIDAGADVNTRINHQMSPLCVAIRKNYTEMVRLLLKHNADVNWRSSDGDTALSYAIEYGCTEIVEILLSHGAKVNETTTQTPYQELRSNPLFFAIKNNRIKIAKLLIAYGANVQYQLNSLYRYTPLHLTVETGNCAMVDLLLIFLTKEDINKMDTRGKTPLSLASGYGFTEIEKMLLNAGANPSFLKNFALTEKEIRAITALAVKQKKAIDLALK